MIESSRFRLDSEPTRLDLRGKIGGESVTLLLPLSARERAIWLMATQAQIRNHRNHQLFACLTFPLR